MRNLVKMFETNTKAKKLQLKFELNTIKRGNVSIKWICLMIKGIVETMSIKVTVDDGDAYLESLGKQYKQVFWHNKREILNC